MTIGVFSNGILEIPHLTSFVNEPIVGSSRGRLPQRVDTIAGWGLRPTSARARRYAEQHDIPYIALEDGFLRSVGLGSQDPPLSLVVDDLGIYYDASRPSRLESLVAGPLTAEAIARAQTLVTAWRNGRLSKYNYARDHTDPLPEPYVLVVDQTLGDASIRFGMADESSFQRMLAAALDENPTSTVLLKVHPEVMAGQKRGYFDLECTARLPRVRIIGQDVHPVNLIERAAAVYVVTSQMGFEGLLWGKRVRTFGMPFYAGWGLTQDDRPAPERRKPVGVENLVHAALVA